MGMSKQQCGCGRFMGKDVFRTVISEDETICHRCWQVRQFRAMIGPIGFKGHLMDAWEAFKDMIKADRRWRVLSFKLCVLDPV